MGADHADHTFMTRPISNGSTAVTLAEVTPMVAKPGATPSNSRSVTLLLNDRCPLRCAHCTVGYSEKKSGSDQKLSAGQIELLIGELDAAVYSMVVLAGGECSAIVITSPG